MRRQVSVIYIIHPDVHVVERSWEEVVDLHGDIQDVANTMTAMQIINLCQKERHSFETETHAYTLAHTHTHIHTYTETHTDTRTQTHAHTHTKELSAFNI